MSMKRESALRHLLGLSLTVLAALPLYWTMVASLRPPGLPPPTSVEWWPSPAHWRNYVEVFRIVPLAHYIRNSLLVVAAAVPATLLTASLAGFGLSQLPDTARRRLFGLSLALLMVPSLAVWMFRFHILGWLGLLDSLWALIVPAFAASSPLFVLLFYWTYWRIPAGLYESARLDGASAGTVWWRIGQPLAWPTTAGVAVLAFIMYWSDFTSPVIYIYRADLYTLPVGLQILKQMDATNWPLLMAAAMIMTLPIVLLFFLLQRRFLHDISLGQVLDRGE
jgi:multiple sugar transport system permease protein